MTLLSEVSLVQSSSEGQDEARHTSTLFALARSHFTTPAGHPVPFTSVRRYRHPTVSAPLVRFRSYSVPRMSSWIEGGTGGMGRWDDVPVASER